MDHKIIRVLSDKDKREIESSLFIYDLNQCLKKLLEISIDSHALKIDIELISNPLTLKISDNGNGIKSSDMQNINNFESHSSTYNKDNDLYFNHYKKIFYCISNVAHLNIISRVEPFYLAYKVDVGLDVMSPTVVSNVSTELKRGTIIVVTKLFDNIPVRKKAMYNELDKNISSLQNTIKVYASIFYSIEFHFDYNSKEVINYNKDNDIKRRFQKIINLDQEKDIIKATYKRHENKIQVLLSIKTFLSKKYQFTFINKRFISIPEITTVVNNKLKLLKDQKKGRHLAYLISIKTNIPDLYYKIGDEYQCLLGKEEMFVIQQLVYNVLSILCNNETLIQIRNPLLHNTIESKEQNVKLGQRYEANENNSVLNLNKNIFKSIKVVGQVDTKYILGYINNLKEGINKTFIMIDQHAAHERIRFEWSDENLKSKNNESLILNPTIIIRRNIAKNDIQDIQNFNKMMKRYGFALKIENNTMILYKIPVFLYSIINKLDSTTKLNALNSQIQNLILHLLEDVKNFTMNEGDFDLSKIPSVSEFSATFACKGAIKFGDKLSTGQCQHIIDQLSLVKFPFICAHGRNTTHVIGSFK